ncbi:MAG: sigma-54 dependent transcriptional regulator [Alphaproteobacteria bacterium]|nr:sigma-54 dependent transcriptional regulator [Alphaproteobacteria bacterium]
MTNTILIAEDDPVQQKMLTMLLTKKLGYKVISVSNGEEAVARVQSSNIGEINAVLLDINMPVMDGFAALKTIRKYRPDLPVLMLTGSDDTNIAVKAIKEGASDFIVKPPEATHLDIAIKNAIRLSALSQELAKLKRDKEGAVAFTDLIGHNAGLAQTVAYGRKAAASDVPVLLMGETGVGKELFARTIHGESKRVTAPFVALNCSTMAHNIEQALFGTGAPGQAGKIRAAEGGTLFLDDITELSPDAQVRLLRVLQQKEIEPSDGGKPIKVNVRVISATDRDIKRDVQTGRFREDLYFRLNVLPITIPALREHREDIVPLAEYFIQRIAVSDRLTPKSLEPDAIDYLLHHAWPGNVRELEGLIHRALVLADSDAIDHAILEQIHESNAQATTPTERRTPQALHINMRHADGSFKTMSEIETETLRTMLAHFENNITRASDILGIAKSTFYRKIKDAR